MALGKYIKKLKDSYKENKGTFIFYLILRAMVILTMIRCIITKEYESVATCVLVLVLFLLPAFIEDIIDVKIPGVFQGIIFAFIFAAEILSEINSENFRAIFDFAKRSSAPVEKSGALSTSR